VKTFHLPKAGQIDPERPAFLSIALDELHTDGVLEAQIHIRTDDKFIKYREPGIPFDGSVRERLRENGHSYIFIRGDEGCQLRRYLEENLQRILADPDADDQQKASVIYDTTVFLVREAISNPSSSEGVRAGKKVAEQAVDFVVSTPGALARFMDLASKDYYTYTHSVNVMLYTVALARRVGYPGGESLTELGQSALLHDVGKSFIDWSITNKDGPLNADEFEVMKRHPEFGFQSLTQSGEMGDHQLYAVRHHHEKLNGRGYPFGLTGSQIDLAVRIISTADIYDALTTRRVYRDAYRSFDGLQVMKEMSGSEIDERVFREFVQLLGEL